MAIKSTIKRRRRKPTDPPDQPYAEFPLRPHSTGYWCKKTKDRNVYFGPWARRVDGRLICLPDGGGYRAAKAKYDNEIHSIQTDIADGRKPRSGSSAASANGVTIKDLCNLFLTRQVRKLNVGELKPKTFAGYKVVAELVIKSFGSNRVVRSLSPRRYVERARTRFVVCFRIRLAGIPVSHVLRRRVQLQARRRVPSGRQAPTNPIWSA